MSKSRPINRRPWRRAPWRKNNRPKRWISLNNGATYSDGGSIVPPWGSIPASATGTQPVIVLASGQVDVEPWADNQEVTIDRIVGQINLQGSALIQTTEVPVPASAPSTWIRLGMIVQEETDATSAPFVDLWNDEHLEDFEWMWLQEVVPISWNYQETTANNLVSWGFTHRIDIDSGLRRKVGPTDNLLLYCQHAISISVPGFETSLVSIDGSQLLRSIFMSK